MTRPRNPWEQHAPALAAWTRKHLVNRDDAHGHYIAVERRRHPDEKAITDKSAPTLAILQRHFAGTSTGDVIGLHSTAIDAEGACTSRWLGIDVDCHADSDDPEANLEAAIAWYERANGLGFRPLLLDSDGRGGYHLILLFDRPLPTHLVFAFGQWLIRDWRDQKLSKVPETFPKQERIEAGGYGNWLRLPGRHHTRDHWSRVWDGSRWLDGAPAIKFIVSTVGTSPDAIPSEALTPPKAKLARRTKVERELIDDAKLAREALEVLDPSCGYDDWIEIGQSLTPLGDEGLALWDEWSQGGGEKYTEGLCDRKWRSFTPDGGRTLGTLFQKAKSRGWTGHKRDLSNVGAPESNGRHRRNGVTTESLEPEPEPERPRIVITTAEHDVNDQAVKALANDPEVYQRGFGLVIVRRDKAPGRGIERPPDSPRIAPLPTPSLRERFARLAEWVKLRTGRNGDEIATPSHPPDWSVSAVAARGEWEGIRHLEAVTETPVMRPDGTIIVNPGYDDMTGILYVPNGDFPTILDRPTRRDARNAASELLAIVCDFPFESEAHRLAWLAGLLTPFARFGFDGPCPLFAIDANAPGVGKTMLADIIAIMATGRKMARTSYPDTDDEMRKTILSVALSGDRLMLIDNIPNGMALGGGALDGALTATHYKGRILGRSEMSADVPLHAVWYATANNMQLKGDSLRRVLPCRLETTHERPEERDGFTIEGDLLAHVRANRGRYVTAALTILRAYASAGRPVAKLTPFGSFEQWSRVVRNAIHWCVEIDPCATREGMAANDPETIARAALVDGWAELPHATRGVTVADALRILKTSPEHYATLRDTIMEWSRNDELPSARIIGNRLKAVRGRVCNGKSLHSIEVRARYLAWKVAIHPDVNGESGESGESLSYPSREKSADKCNTHFKENGGNQTHQTHQTHHEGEVDREVIRL